MALLPSFAVSGLSFFSRRFRSFRFRYGCVQFSHEVGPIWVKTASPRAAAPRSAGGLWRCQLGPELFERLPSCGSKSCSFSAMVVAGRVDRDPAGGDELRAEFAGAALADAQPVNQFRLEYTLVTTAKRE
jgi:hypothetical protein